MRRIARLRRPRPATALLDDRRALSLRIDIAASVRLSLSRADELGLCALDQVLLKDPGVFARQRCKARADAHCGCSACTPRSLRRIRLDRARTSRTDVANEGHQADARSKHLVEHEPTGQVGRQIAALSRLDDERCVDQQGSALDQRTVAQERVANVTGAGDQAELVDQTRQDRLPRAPRSTIRRGSRTGTCPCCDDQRCEGLP